MWIQLLKYWKYIVILILALFVVELYLANKKYQKHYSTAIENIKAYSAENSSLKKEKQVFQFSIDQLKYLNDSINDKLLKQAKELKIKDKQIKSLQYYKETFSKSDTIRMTDTIFTPKVNIDTVLGDQYYSLHLNLKYPNFIAVNPHFINEKSIIVAGKKETINPPSKIFFIKWFQKKQTVLNIYVIDSNPYVDTKEQRFIQILK